VAASPTSLTSLIHVQCKNEYLEKKGHDMAAKSLKEEAENLVLLDL
jgi:hypothetical protein